MNIVDLSDVLKQIKTEMQQEMDGTGGSGQAGHGPTADKYLEYLKNQEDSVLNLNNKYSLKLNAKSKELELTLYRVDYIDGEEKDYAVFDVSCIIEWASDEKAVDFVLRKSDKQYGLKTSAFRKKLSSVQVDLDEDCGW